MSKALQSNEFAYGILTILSIIMCFYSYQKELPLPPPVGDGYERIAYAIANTGVYSMNFSETAQPEVSRAPLYPAFLSLFITEGSNYKTYLECTFIERKKTCQLETTAPYFAQGALYVLLTIMIYATARILGAKKVSSIFFSLFALYIISNQALHYRVSEALALPLFTLTIYLCALYFSGRNKAYIFAFLGVTLALLALTRVAYIYMVPILAITILFISPRSVSLSFMKRAKYALITVLVCASVLSPWLYRSYQLTDRIIIGESGLNGVLGVRAEYNKMNLQEAMAGFVYWIPGSGDSMAKKIFPKEVWEKFDPASKNSFRQAGFKRVPNLKKEGYTEDEAKEILMKEFKRNPVKHALVSVLIAWRGLRFSLPFVPFLIGGLAILAYRRDWWALGILMPTIFNYAFHAGFSHFHPRYGYPMTIGFAPFAALFGTWLWIKFFRKKNAERT